MQIDWNASKALEFRTAYLQAVRKGKTSFQFEGHTFTVKYATELVNHLTNKLKLLEPV